MPPAAAHVVCFGHRGGRRYLARAKGSGTGRGPFTWVREPAGALTFPTAAAARAYAMAELGHGFFDVRAMTEAF